MSDNALDKLRAACTWAKANGHKLLRGGATFDFTKTPWSCDAIGALLLQNGMKEIPKDLCYPGFGARAKELLGVDDFWLRRWWMGWDRGNLVTLTIVAKGSEKETKDEVSASAVALWREFNK